MRNTVAKDEPLGARSETFFSRLFVKQQRRLSDAFVELVQRGQAADTVLDVGRATLREQENTLSCYVDESLRSRIRLYKIPILAPDIASASFPIDEKKLSLPFRNAEFDWVFCNGVIEHVGDAGQQHRLVEELMRVAGKGVFLATQNSRHPIDFHAFLPFVHWLPDQWRRHVISWIGRNAIALEPPPRFLNSGALYRFAQSLPEQPEHDVGHKRVFGIKAHFFLMITKKQ